MKYIFRIFVFIIACLVINRCLIANDNSGNKKAIFYAPIKSPFKHNIGINFSVEMTNWFIDPSIKYNQTLQRQYTFGRLVNISKDFKLIRIYSFLIAGWEQTGTMSAEGYALARLAKQDQSVEAVVATSNNIAWYMSVSNVQMFVDTLQNKFGSAISQVKTILIGNEINANSYTKNQIDTIMCHFKTTLKKNKLNIPVSVSFNNLPVRSGDVYSDSLIASVVENWDTTWNDNKPFVFIDPYPDASGINNASGIYKWQYNVTKYYASKYPSLQIFIGETGAEGSSTNHKTTVIVDSVFNQLNIQYDSIKKTVPTFLFEAVNEPQKPSIPNQQYMGLYYDSSSPEKINLTLKSGIELPKWLNK
jgi:hypothetical protein